MNEAENQDLLNRLRELEAEVSRLRGQGTETAPPSAPPPLPLPSSVPPSQPPPLPGARPPATATAADRFSTLINLENVLSKIGIGLLLVGLVYLLKVSYDRGWFTPEVRIGLGLGLATGLLVGGLRLLGRRAVLGQVLAGGGLAVYYICFYAAEQFYGLIKPTPAFLAMLGVTLGGYALSLRKRVVPPVVIALLGGLAAPFLLGNHDLAVVPVAVYTLLLLTGAAAVYWSLGWSAVWWTGLLGGAFILHSLGNHISASSPDRQIDQTALTLAYVLWWAAHASLPLGRLLGQGDSSRGLRACLTVGAYLVPALGLWGIIGVWSLPRQGAGGLILASALVCLLMAQGLRLHPGMQKAYRLAALLLAVIGFLLLLEGDAGFLVVTALGFTLLEAFRRTRENVLQVFGHLTFAVAAVWLVVRFTESVYPPVAVRPTALCNLAAVVALLAVWFRHPKAGWRGVYWIVGTVSALVWLAREAELAPESLAWVTLLWGIYALVLIVASVIRWNAWVRRTGLVLLVVVLAKMVLVDLATVPTEWRVVLFMGLGGLMLGISYLLPRLAGGMARKPEGGPSSAPAAASGTSGVTPPPAPSQEPPPLP